MARLRRSDCGADGITRKGRGRGFQYLDPAGRAVADPDVLERIAALAIPPAWREVWVCLDPLGHLQATGVDDAGRKQYLYHERWRVSRNRRKYDTMVAFGEALPKLRRRVAGDLDATADGITRERALACALRLLDLGFFRIGSEDYAVRNASYGLTTMLREHVTVDGEALVFDFPAKSGQRRIQSIVDPDARLVVAALKRRRGGEQLLAYRAGRRWVDLHADDVNAYIKQAAGDAFSAKDFRTFNATVLAAVALAGADDGRAPSKRTVAAAIRTTAAYLGNTPAVCRASYVDPRVIDRYEAGVTIRPALRAGADGPDLANARVRRRVENAVLDLIA
jgi:DNA topoisomerase-1